MSFECLFLAGLLDEALQGIDAEACLCGGDDTGHLVDVEGSSKLSQLCLLLLA